MAIEKDLEKLKEIFLSGDIDSEDYEDNLKLISSWELDLRANEEFAGWQTSDITKSIITQAKESYKNNAVLLMTNRELTEKARESIWAKQDAMIFLLSLVEKDTKSAIGQIHREIRQALKVE